LPQPDFLEFSLPDTHHALITNDGSALTQQVITSLKKDGNKVVVLNLPNIANPIAENAVNIATATDVAIGEAIQNVRTQYGKTGTFIHLHPHFEFQNGNFKQHFDAEKAVVKTLFFLSKHLQKDLNELGEQQRANFLAITRMDGKLGQGKRGNTSVIGGGITGLVKCLNLEWSAVFCRVVDVEPELSNKKVTTQILSELHDANTGIVEVTYSDEGRKTTVALPVEVFENKSIDTTVTNNSVFLVSGGARGVTANCVIEMAKTFQCKFMLLGRSDFDFVVPEYAKNESDDGIIKRLIMNDLKEKGQKPSLPLVKKIHKDIVAKKEIDSTIAQIEKCGS